MACIKKKKTNPKLAGRKARYTQTRPKKPQGTKYRPKQVAKNGKTSLRRVNSCPAKCCQLTKKARGVLSSCMEHLCQEVYSEANRIRKKINEPFISHKVLLTALEQSMAKEDILRSLTDQAMKTKKKTQPPVDTAQKTSCPSEKQAAPTKVLHKSRKASSVFHECC